MRFFESTNLPFNIYETETITIRHIWCIEACALIRLHSRDKFQHFDYKCHDSNSVIILCNTKTRKFIDSFRSLCITSLRKNVYAFSVNFHHVAWKIHIKVYVTQHFPTLYSLVSLHKFYYSSTHLRLASKRLGRFPIFFVLLKNTSKIFQATKMVWSMPIIHVSRITPSTLILFCQLQHFQSRSPTTRGFFSIPSTKQFIPLTRLGHCEVVNSLFFFFCSHTAGAKGTIHIGRRSRRWHPRAPPSLLRDGRTR